MAPPQADLFTRPDEGPCPLAENPAALTVTSVTLNGLQSVPAESLAAAYAPFLDRPGDASDLCRIRDAVADALFDRGVLARVEIPAQTIDGGKVTLEVIEAKIVNVSVRGDPGPAGPLLERYAQRMRGMSPFNIDEVQRYVLLATDVPGLKVQASIRPNLSGERGAVDLDLTVTRDAQDLIVNAQNLQGKATGRFGFLARYDLNSRSRHGERTSLVFYRTIRNEQWVAQALEEVRLGDDGWIARGGVAYGESRPGDSLKPLGLKSTSLVATLEAAYPLIRKRRVNLTAAAGFEYIDQDTRIGGGGKLINDDLRIFYARAEGEQTTYWWGYRPIVMRGSASIRRGIEGFGATDEGDRLLSRAGARTSAWSVQAEASFLAVVTPQVSIYGEAQGQYANQPLVAYEEFAVGNLTIGRGYDPGYVSGDQAMAATLEVRGGPFQPRAGWALSPYAFVDIAHTRDKDRGGRDQTLKSVGAGVQVPVRDRWVLDVAYARPLDKRDFDRKRPPGRLLLNLTARFF